MKLIGIVRQHNEHQVLPVTLDARVIKMGLLTVALAAFSGCGDSGNGDGGGVSATGDGPVSTSTLQLLGPAKLTSTDAVVLLAPGSMFANTVGPTQGFLAFAGSFGSSVGKVEESTDCGLGGRVEVIDQSLDDLASPYTGAAFDTVLTDQQACREGVELPGGSLSGSYVDGRRLYGYPSQGPGSGSSATEDVFIAYEKSGDSFDEPFYVEQSSDGKTLLSWSRLWDGHVRLLRGDNPEAAIGDGGGETELSSISQFESFADDGARTTTRVQIGASMAAEDNFDFSYTPRVGTKPAEARTERYSGSVGSTWVEIGGRPALSSCPSGVVSVSTQQDLIVETFREGESNPILGQDEVIGGVLNMEDNFGNEATVSYDGPMKTVAVSLNGGASRLYTYDDILRLWQDLCVSPSSGS